jgi:hypothetical protein
MRETFSSLRIVFTGPYNKVLPLQFLLIIKKWNGRLGSKIGLSHRMSRYALSSSEQNSFHVSSTDYC